MDTLNERFAAEGVAWVEEQLISLQDRTTMLEKSKLGQGLTWQELQTLAGYLSPFEAKTGVYVCRQGDKSDFMSIIFRGRVSIIKSDFNHQDKEIASVGPGQTVGEMSMIDGEARSASVVVKNPVLMLVLSEESFEKMAEEVPRLWGKLLLRLARIMSRRLRQTSGILAEYLH